MERCGVDDKEFSVLVIILTITLMLILNNLRLLLAEVTVRK